MPSDAAATSAATGTVAVRVRRRSLRAAIATTATSQARAGSSNAAASAAQSPAAANVDHDRAPWLPIRCTSHADTAVQAAAGRWFVSTTANVVRKVPQAARAAAHSRPQSVVPTASTSRHV